VDRGYAHPLYSKRILDEEYANYGLSRQLDQAPRWLKRFDHWRRETEDALEEFERANYVFVPSDFCYQSFVQEGYPPEKLVMIPRGFDPSQFYRHDVTNQAPVQHPFRAIFLGLLTVRKGLKYLLEAWQALALPQAELLLVGTLHEELQPLLQPYLNHSSLTIRHIDFTPNPAELLRNADVFVFPSLDEGSAKVTYEAMACGLPVITTANSGSLVRDGQDGYIVPIRSRNALMEKLEYYYQHRDVCEQMGKTAQAYISQFTWDRYETTLIEHYQALFTKKITEKTSPIA
ncbi:MAG TPA: glycosyltransferase, partial [Thiothrix sp.]|nr:glycosyltransferase [Thiothrix sp.]